MESGFFSHMLHPILIASSVIHRPQSINTLHDLMIYKLLLCTSSKAVLFLTLLFFSIKLVVYKLAHPLHIFLNFVILHLLKGKKWHCIVYIRGQQDCSICLKLKCAFGVCTYTYSYIYVVAIFITCKSSGGSPSRTLTASPSSSQGMHVVG